MITAYTALLSRQPNVKEHAESGLEQYVYKTITDLDLEEQDPLRLSSSQAQARNFSKVYTSCSCLRAYT